MILTYKRRSNACDYFICADSSTVKCKKTKKPPHNDFCSKSSSHHCSSSSSSSSDDSCSSKHSSKSDHSDHKKHNHKGQGQKKDAVEAIQSILACQAFDVKCLVGIKANEIENLTSCAFDDVNREIDAAINASSERLICETGRILDDESLAHEIAEIICEANCIFEASALRAVISGQFKVNQQLRCLSKQCDEKILESVKDEKHGISCLINEDFDEIRECIKREFPIIEEKELCAVFEALKCHSNSEAVAEAIRAETFILCKAVYGIICNAKNALLSSICCQFKELELSLDLLFCETNHLVIDLVKQIGYGKKVIIPHGFLCNPLLKHGEVKNEADNTHE